MGNSPSLNQKTGQKAMAERVNNHNLIIADFGFRTGRVFAPLFPESAIFRNPSQINQNSVIVFEGGTDIDPGLYGEKRGSHTYIADWKRDDFENSLYRIGRRKGSAFIGICRGAQLLTALNGGKLFQDVAGHGISHQIKTDTGKIMPTTSLHHQMMNPFMLSQDAYKIVAWSLQPQSSYYDNGDDLTKEIPEVEPEVVWFPRTKSLCIQGHPEFAAEQSQFRQYCQALVRRFIINRDE